MDKVKKAPAIRFKDFDDEWNSIKIKKICEFFNGVGHENNVSEYGQYVIINSKFISTEGQVKKYTTDQLMELKKDDIVFVMSDLPHGKALGKTFLVTEDNKYTLNQRIGCYRTFNNKENSPSFINMIVNRNPQYLFYDDGVNQTNLKKDEILNIDLHMPSYPEQVRISRIFKNLDEKLELEKEKHEKLKIFKKAMLEDMFPKEGEKVPKVRFEGFDDEWQEKELSTIVQITMGQSPSSSNYSDSSNEGLYLLIQGNADLHKRKVIPRVWTSQVTRKADRGDIIMSVRAPAGTVGKTEYDAVIGRGVASIKGNEFIYQMLIKMEDSYWEKISTGSTFDSIDKKTINEAVAFIPEATEQTLIGNFFKTLDEKIELSEKKIVRIENFKKAMLDKMFV